MYEWTFQAQPMTQFPIFFWRGAAARAVTERFNTYLHYVSKNAPRSCDDNFVKS